MKRLISVVVTCAALGTAPAFAGISDDDFAQLKSDLTAMAQRLDALEAENTALRELSKSTVTELDVTRSALNDVQHAATASAWTDRVKLKGDLRYRYEAIDVQEADTRRRNRIRSRAELTAKVSENVSAGIGIASGGSDPVSSNQTLGGGGSSKDLKLDLAYAKWKANENLSVQLGKFKNPLYKPQKSSLLWDGDWRPEGISAGWADERWFGTLFGTWLESDTKRDNDAFAWGLQAGTRFNLGDAELTMALAFYDFPTGGKSSFFDDDFFGNASIDGVYQTDYEMIELGADLSMSAGDMPLAVFANYVKNQDADDYDTGWTVGAKLGKANGRGTWQIGYLYQDLEADAVLGLLSDSDFAGGGTDVKGHKLSGAYGINKNWNVSFSWFINNETGEKALMGEGGALDYDRLMLDTVFKF